MLITTPRPDPGRLPGLRTAASYAVIVLWTLLATTLLQGAVVAGDPATITAFAMIFYVGARVWMAPHRQARR